MREVLRAYQDAVAGEVPRLEGHVAKFMGDGVLAYFGWPQAHEDEAERAVRAGLASSRRSAGWPRPRAALGRGRDRHRARRGRRPRGRGRGAGGGGGRRDAQPRGAPAGARPAGRRWWSARRPGGWSAACSSSRLSAPALKGFAGRSRLRACWAKVGRKPLRGAARGSASPRWSAASRSSRSSSSAGSRPRTARARSCCSGRARHRQVAPAAALRERLADEPCLPLSHYCSPYHQASALCPVIDLLERAAGFARDDTPRASSTSSRRCWRGHGRRPSEAVPASLAALLSVPTADRYPPWTSPRDGRRSARSRSWWTRSRAWPGASRCWRSTRTCTGPTRPRSSSWTW